MDPLGTKRSGWKVTETGFHKQVSETENNKHNKQHSQTKENQRHIDTCQWLHIYIYIQLCNDTYCCQVNLYNLRVLRIVTSPKTNSVRSPKAPLVETNNWQAIERLQRMTKSTHIIFSHQCPVAVFATVFQLQEQLNGFGWTCLLRRSINIPGEFQDQKIHTIHCFKMLFLGNPASQKNQLPSLQESFLHLSGLLRQHLDMLGAPHHQPLWHLAGKSGSGDHSAWPSSAHGYPSQQVRRQKHSAFKGRHWWTFIAF